jgi:hypothetical protein
MTELETIYNEEIGVLRKSWDFYFSTPGLYNHWFHNHEKPWCSLTKAVVK